MLLAGLGWGNMPAHMVEDEIKDGRLTVIQPAGSDSLTPLVLGAAYISEHSLGPAGKWMLKYLTSVASASVSTSDPAALKVIQSPLRK